MELYKSPVVFDQSEHTYTLEGKRLHGITGMLSRQLFPDKYAAIPKYILDRAAEKGSYIHEVCEIVDSLGVSHECPEAKHYLRLKDEWGLCHLTSEYLVSDEKYFASSIDKVYLENDNEVTLADIKTTSHLDEDYVSWQLSVYAYLFERQNPGIKVVRLLAVWLRPDTAKIIEVRRVSDDTISKLLDCEVNGIQFVNPFQVPETSADLPAKYKEMEASIIEIDRMAKYWADQKKKLTEGVMTEMLKAGVTKWKGDKISFTRKEDTTREGFDLKRFKEEHADLYDHYKVLSQVKGSVILKAI